MSFFQNLISLDTLENQLKLKLQFSWGFKNLHCFIFSGKLTNVPSPPPKKNTPLYLALPGSGWVDLFNKYSNLFRVHLFAFSCNLETDFVLRGKKCMAQKVPYFRFSCRGMLDFVEDCGSDVKMH